MKKKKEKLKKDEYKNAKRRPINQKTIFKHKL